MIKIKLERKTNMITSIKNRTIYSNNDYPYYVFTSDVHGTLDTISYIKHAIRDFPTAQLVGGGDYIDGRKHSKEVCDFLINKAEHNNAVILNGNHEEMMIDFADGHDIYELGQEPLWYFNGGKKTIKSFLGRGFSKIKTAKYIRESYYYSYFKNNNLMYITPHYIFVHAGVIPNSYFDDPAKYTDYNNFRIWERDNYIKDEHGYFAHNYTNRTIVTGHTPTCFIQGNFDDKRVMPKTDETRCIIKISQYPGECKRVFTDGGAHSAIPTNKGNVTVFDSYGNIVRIYNYSYPTGINFDKYCDIYQKQNIFGMTIA